MLTQVAAGRTYDYSHSVGRGAQSGMGFNQPVSVALGKDDRMYVVNRGSESISNVAWNRTGIGARVSRITVGPTPGDEEFLGEFSKYGNNDGEFIWGSGVAVDSRENIYVSDEWLNQISVFDKDGNFQKKWSALEKDDGQPHGVANIAIDAQDHIYLTDGRSHEVRKFTTSGQFLASWGSLGSENGQFNSPWGITVDRQGCVYVADHRNDRCRSSPPTGSGWPSLAGPVPVAAACRVPPAWRSTRRGTFTFATGATTGCNRARCMYSIRMASSSSASLATPNSCPSGHR
jgi:sugar lactone lactonase YvrE